MLNSNFPEKSLGLVSPPHFVYVSMYILLTDYISLSDFLYFSIYWVTCVLQLFVNQAVWRHKIWN